MAKLFIDERFNANIDLNLISGAAYCSKFHFIRLFRKVYGLTPHQYLISVRIKHAMGLLLEGHSVLHACLETGFESITSFSSLFKKHTGKGPACWQEERTRMMQDQQNRPLHYIPGCFSLQAAS